MKRHLALLLVLLPLIAFAQHLSFLGIPLDGTIKEFQNELRYKGIKKSKFKGLPTGTKAFKGRFSGYESDIYIYFVPDTKTVYRAKACMKRDSRLGVEKLMQEFKRNITEKYAGRCDVVEGTENGYRSYEIVVYDKADSRQIIGDINLYITYSQGYCFYVDYYDMTNSLQNDRYNMDDL